MARPLRIEYKGAFYHITDRGNERKRSGHLFQGRYKAILVDAHSYFLELSRYVHLNPVRTNMWCLIRKTIRTAAIPLIFTPSGLSADEAIMSDW